MATAVSAAVAHGSAHAQAALDDPSTPAPTGEAAPTEEPAAAPATDVVEYGVGVRLRNVRIPQGELELFVESAPGGTSNVGFGVDLTRRRGNVELQLGFEYERITPAEGVYIERDRNVAAGDEADFIVSPEHNIDGEALGWFTFEFTFLNHAPITKQLAFRYGGGAGLGIITGSLGRYNVACVGATNDSPEPGCRPASLGGNAVATEGGPNVVKYNLPPVFPVVNAIIGLQYRPVPKATVNFEMGIRTLLFIGLSGSYFF